jgi:RimJ/RimL family protein N-acetyltransferase
VEIGSRLLPIAWGRGLALEGGEIMLEHAFTTLGLPRVWGICHPDNRSAQAVLAALGFEADGIARYDGQDACHHVIDLNAWRESRNTSRRSRLRRAIAVRRTESAREAAASAL